MKRIIWTTEVCPQDIQAVMEDYKVPEGEAFEIAQENIAFQLEDEKMNLDIEIDNPILVIANLGLWNGQRQGYKILNRNNISALFSVRCRDSLAATFYADAYNVYCDDDHHDGTNQYLFRELIGTDSQCSKLCSAIYNGREYESLMKRYSRSILPYIAAVYGWPVAGRRKSCSIC